MKSTYWMPIIRFADEFQVNFVENDLNDGDSISSKEMITLTLYDIILIIQLTVILNPIYEIIGTFYEIEFLMTKIGL